MQQLAIPPMPDDEPASYPWLQGEHVTVIGDTGTGKTFLISRLVRLRQYVVVFKTKGDPDDDSKWRGFKRTRFAKTLRDPKYSRIVLEPEYRYQAREGWLALEHAFRQGGWTFVIDEQWHAERLGLKAQIERMLTQGRSLNLSAVIGMQRPVQATRFAISQSTHLFTFRLEGRDTKTVADSTTPRIVPIIESLRGHDFAYYNRARRSVATGNAKSLGRVILSPFSIDTGAAGTDN